VKNVTLDKLISALFTRLTCKSMKVCWLKLGIQATSCSYTAFFKFSFVSLGADGR